MPTISLFSVVHVPEMDSNAVAVLRSGKIAGGDYVAQFEQGLGAIIGQRNVVSTVDMTSAMQMALHLAGCGDGDEVLTTAFACMSTNAAIAQCGAIPVWVDVQAGMATMCIDDLATKFSAKTKAVILYHAAGYPAPAAQIAKLCQQHGVALIEDCDNALFATCDGQPVGAHGEFAVYSFYPNRQINTTEGGALVCKSEQLAVRARKLRRFGIDGSTFRARSGEIDPASDIPEIGWSFTMNNLCAAIGCAQFATVAGRLATTRANVLGLVRHLQQLPGVTLVRAAPNSNPAYWALLVLVDRRDAVLASLKSQGVNASSLHQRNDIYSGFHTTAGSDLPNTTYLQEHVIALPCGWWLGPDDVTFIGAALEHALSVAALP